MMVANQAQGAVRITGDLADAVTAKAASAHAFVSKNSYRWHLAGDTAEVEQIAARYASLGQNYFDKTSADLDTRIEAGDAKAAKTEWGLRLSGLSWLASGSLASTAGTVGVIAFATAHLPMAMESGVAAAGLMLASLGLRQIAVAHKDKLFYWEQSKNKLLGEKALIHDVQKLAPADRAAVAALAPDTHPAPRAFRSEFGKI